jgi:intraflagellar transport protein 46
MSKKSYLDLLIREFYKGKIKEEKSEIHTISNSHKNPKLVSGWIADVEEIHKKRVAPSVFYTKKMPDIDNLMQMWDSDFESTLMKVKLTDPSIPIATNDLAKIACNLFDIPVHETTDNRNMIESMHVLFTLYSAFISNDHFHNNNSSAQGLTNMQRMEFN